MSRWSQLVPLALALGLLLGATSRSEAQLFRGGRIGLGIGFGGYGYPAGWGGYPMMGYGSGVGIGFGRGYYRGGPYSSYGYSPYYYDYSPYNYGYAPATDDAGYQNPAYYQSAYAAAPTLSDSDVLLDVRVPASARVWVNGDATTQTGSRREYISNDLTPGKSYIYTIKARWTEGGKPVEREKRVRVHGGERQVVDFGVPS